MRKIYTLFLTAFISAISFGQTTLASWNFTDNNAVADGGIAANAAAALTTTASGAVVYVATPTPPVAAPYQSAPGWDAGVGTKYWQTTISTAGYTSIFLNSVQRSSNTGPANFQIQCDCGTGFTTISTVTIQNNWTSGVTSNLALPTACNNNPAVIIRWGVSSTTAVNAGTVAAGGTSGIDDVSVIALSILPVSFTDFTAKKNGTAVDLSWSAYSTAASGIFSIEKSSDGRTFSAVGEVPALNGDHTYHFTDPVLSKGTAFYRIAVKEIGQSQKYSSILRVTNETKGLSLNSLFPSPASAIISLQINSDKKQNARLEILDVNGRTMAVHTLGLQEGIVNYPLAIQTLSSGNYLIRISTAEETITGRFIKK
jgi:Secretion system C-terminal sorting domain